MTDVEWILGLIRARAAHQTAHVYTSVDDEAWEAERLRYVARSQALEDLAAEIHAAAPVKQIEPDNVHHKATIVVWVLSTATGGDMNARLFSTREAATAAQDLYMENLRMWDEFSGYATCGLNEVAIAPRRTESIGGLDGRYALVTYDQHITETSIHETLEELDAAIDQFKEDHDYESDESSSLYDWHYVLIPRQSKPRGLIF